jgi:hypothetical protein
MKTTGAPTIVRRRLSFRHGELFCTVVADFARPAHVTSASYGSVTDEQAIGGSPEDPGG